MWEMEHEVENRGQWVSVSLTQPELRSEVNPEPSCSRWGLCETPLPILPTTDAPFSKHLCRWITVSLSQKLMLLSFMSHWTGTDSSRTECKSSSSLCYQRPHLMPDTGRCSVNVPHEYLNETMCLIGVFTCIGRYLRTETCVFNLPRSL